MRLYQKTAGLDRFFQLARGQGKTRGVLVRKVCEGFSAKPMHRTGIPMKLAMDGGKVSLPLLVLFIAKKACNLVLRKQRSGVQEGVDILFEERRVIFRVDE